MVHHRSEDRRANHVGKTICNGSLLLREVLGSGTYGLVYRATDLLSPTRAQYAVKCLDKKRCLKIGLDYSRELSLHATVNDIDGVIKMHRVFESKEFLFIIFDLCTGGDILDGISGINVFWRNDALVKSTMLQLIDALDLCHRRDIYHRDLKPENILMSKDRTKVWLADFGLATTKCVNDEFGCGSRLYMSPESIDPEVSIGAISSRHSDIWALGIILINMLAGRNPWHRASPEDEGFAEFLRNPEVLSYKMPISREANIILRHVLAESPVRRLTLRALRDCIEDVHSFFMTDVELSCASRDAQKCAIVQTGGYLFPPKLAPVPARVAPPPPSPIPSASQMKPIDAEEVFFHAISHSSESSFSVSSASNVSTCSLESAGPVTPETAPVLGDADVSPMGSAVMGEGKKRRSFLKTALRKLKVL
ncbi:kinase-like protein [Dentipellis sp. KUC8613]|nr:kinase-like protein [Dentipellis sp. KUC8613]